VRSVGPDARPAPARRRHVGRRPDCGDPACRPCGYSDESRFRHHRLVIPGSFLAGAILLTWADLLARTMVAPAEMPIGIITAILGAPFFIWILINVKQIRK
ncbi:MAG: iron ABC transporter permease, partial [Cyclobacteriaceae bacterium]|nr:iron ABC transporter permease [Cyclobacteriaceae bacterium]